MDKKNHNPSTIAEINEVAILIVEDGDKVVPIKPICQALGIAEEVQAKKIKNDEILSSVATLRVATGADGKQYEMFCIDYRYVFGWLFTINPINVKPEAKEAVLKYKKACYDVLYDHFTDSAKFLEDKDLAIQKGRSLLAEASLRVKEAKDIEKEAKKVLETARNYTLTEWKDNNNQLSIFVDSEMKTTE